MEWWVLLILLLGGLIGLMVLGLPVAFSFFVMTMIFMFMLMRGQQGLSTLMLSMFDSLTKFNLTPIPFFLLLGEVLFHSGLASRTIDVLSKWLGAIPGRLSVITLLSGGLFAALSGTTVANTALFGTLMTPEMLRRGYSKGLTLGPIMGSGALAMIIPPSSLAVLLGSLAEVSIGGLLIAAIIPGLVLLALFLSYTIIRALLNPSLAPKYEIDATDARDKIISALRDLVPMFAIVFLVTGLILVGVATPTEAAAVGAFGAVVLTASFRVLTRDVLKKSILGTLKVSAMILTIIAGSSAFSQILAYSGASRELVEIVLSWGASPLTVLLIMLGVVVVMGCFMEQVSIMMITIPIFMPIVGAMGIHPIWFAVLMLVCLEIGQLTPPFGLALFVMKGVAPKEISMTDVYKAAVPFVACNFIGIALVISFPALATWLPGFL